MRLISRSVAATLSVGLALALLIAGPPTEWTKAGVLVYGSYVGAIALAHSLLRRPSQSQLRVAALLAWVLLMAELAWEAIDAGQSPSGSSIAGRLLLWALVIGPPAAALASEGAVRRRFSPVFALGVTCGLLVALTARAAQDNASSPLAILDIWWIPLFVLLSALPVQVYYTLREDASGPSERGAHGRAGET